MLGILVIFQLFVYVLSFDFGLSPKYYKIGEPVDLLVNKAESDHTQLPYAYYDLRFVCPRLKGKKALHLSLGEILRGDRIYESDYKLNFGIDNHCTRLCDFKAKEAQLKFADQLIKSGYVVHWSVDGLPGATTFVSNNKNSKYYAAGFPLGFFNKDQSYLYNHFMLVIRYHTEKHDPSLHTIVGFEVYPKSVVDETCPGSLKDYKNLAVNLKKDSKGKIAPVRIPYTYSVYWREDNSVDYQNRWALYYQNDNIDHSRGIHLVSFLNSIVLLFLVSLIVAIILFRILKSDLSKSSTLPTTVDENNGWKNLNNEVTKKPQYPLVLSMFVSSGLQLMIATVGIIFTTIIKSQFETQPQGSQFNNYQGAFTSFALSCFVLSGIIPSFIGIILYKIFNNDGINNPYPRLANYKLSILFSGFLPILILSFMIFFNFFVFAKESSNALPFGTIVVLLVLFLLIMLPLGLIGGHYGNKTKFKDSSFYHFASLPKSTKTLKPSPITNTPSRIIKNTVFLMIMYGLIPFGVVYVELSFILNSIWLEKTSFYYMYGFLFITIIMLMVIIAESAIIGIYINLIVDNNPSWQWLCFRIGCSIGLYIYGYSFYYFFNHLFFRDFVSILLYFAYMGLISLLVGITCGSVSVITGFIFIKKIYSSRKSD